MVALPLYSTIYYEWNSFLHHKFVMSDCQSTPHGQCLMLVSNITFNLPHVFVRKSPFLIRSIYEDILIKTDWKQQNNDASRRTELIRRRPMKSVAALHQICACIQKWCHSTRWHRSKYCTVCDQQDIFC